jgi:predicted CXXCH cytochrome family protein
MRSPHRFAFIVWACAVVFACVGKPADAPHAVGKREVKSNVLRGDYAGSAACDRCHHDIVEKWRASPMHNMTRVADAGVSKAPFSGVALRFKDDRVELDEKDGKRFVHIRSARFGDADYRVTRVIGGHYREDYAGVPVSGEGRDEVVLPVSFLLWSKKFRYKGYSVMSRERPGVAAGPVWNRTCIFCHNTEPYLSDMLGAFVDRGEGARSNRRAAYQGELVDPLLPAALRTSVAIDDASHLDDALEDEVEHLTGARPSGCTPPADCTTALAWQTLQATRERFTARDLIEVGIGCEACHGGSKEHVADPTVKTSLAPHTPGFHFNLGNGSGVGSQASLIDRTCARCHQVLFSRYPYTWEGGRRDHDPGGSHINSGEARDFLLGACSKQAACTLCHDPHAPDNKERSARLETREGDAVCTQCHGSLATETAQRAHTHHDPNGAGGRCIACHMPKKNMSLDLGLGRYHRIASPNDAVKMLDRPLECALCHGDATVAKLADDMERLWGKRIDRTVLDGIYGSLTQNVLDATLARGKPHEQAVAMSLLGERRERRATRAIAAELTNEYPLVRFYAEHALELISGEPSPLDLYASDDDIRAAGIAWVSRISP